MSSIWSTVELFVYCVGQSSASSFNGAAGARQVRNCWLQGFRGFCRFVNINIRGPTSYLPVSRDRPEATMAQCQKCIKKQKITWIRTQEEIKERASQRLTYLLTRCIVFSGPSTTNWCIYYSLDSFKNPSPISKPHNPHHFLTPTHTNTKSESSYSPITLIC